MPWSGRGAPVLLMPQGGLGLAAPACRLADGRMARSATSSTTGTVSYAPSGYALHSQFPPPWRAPTPAALPLAIVNPTKDLPFTPAEGKAVINLFADC